MTRKVGASGLLFRSVGGNRIPNVMTAYLVLLGPGGWSMGSLTSVSNQNLRATVIVVGDANELPGECSQRKLSPESVVTDLRRILNRLSAAG